MTPSLLGNGRRRCCRQLLTAAAAAAAGEHMNRYSLQTDVLIGCLAPSTPKHHTMHVLGIM